MYRKRLRACQPMPLGRAMRTACAKRREGTRDLGALAQRAVASYAHSVDSAEGREAVMAKKARKTIAAKRKTVKTAKKRTSKKMNPKTASKAKPPRKRREEARVTSISDKVLGGFQTLVDTIRETDVLRKKIERPGSAET
jgi:hypothetical protein